MPAKPPVSRAESSPNSQPPGTGREELRAVTAQLRAGLTALRKIEGVETALAVLLSGVLIGVPLWIYLGLPPAVVSFDTVLLGGILVIDGIISAALLGTQVHSHLRHRRQWEELAASALLGGPGLAASLRSFLQTAKGDLLAARDGTVLLAFVIGFAPVLPGLGWISQLFYGTPGALGGILGFCVLVIPETLLPFSVFVGLRGEVGRGIVSLRAAQEELDAVSWRPASPAPSRPTAVREAERSPSSATGTDLNASIRTAEGRLSALAARRRRSLLVAAIGLAAGELAVLALVLSRVLTYSPVPPGFFWVVGIVVAIPVAALAIGVGLLLRESIAGRAPDPESETSANPSGALSELRRTADRVLEVDRLAGWIGALVGVGAGDASFWGIFFGLAYSLRYSPPPSAESFVLLFVVTPLAGAIGIAALVDYGLLSYANRTTRPARLAAGRVDASLRRFEDEFWSRF
jgi:hypothetical protein